MFPKTGQEFLLRKTLPLGKGVRGPDSTSFLARGLAGSPSGVAAPTVVGGVGHCAAQQELGKSGQKQSNAGESNIVPLKLIDFRCSEWSASLLASTVPEESKPQVHLGMRVVEWLLHVPIVQMELGPTPLGSPGFPRSRSRSYGGGSGIQLYVGGGILL